MTVELSATRPRAPALLHPIEVEVASTVAGVPAADWDRAVGNGYLSTTHRWTLAFEKGPRKEAQTIFLVRRAGELLAAVCARRATRFPISSFKKGASWGQLLATLPFFPPIQAPSALMFIAPWTQNTSFAFRADVDPAEIAPALLQAFRSQDVGALVTIGVPFTPRGDARELCRLAMGGTAFPLLQSGFYPPMKGSKYIESLPGRRKRELGYNRRRAEEAGFRIEFTKDLSAEAEVFADLVTNTRTHHWSEGRFIPPIPGVMCAAWFYRWLHDTFPGEAEMAKVVGSDNVTRAAFLIFHGPQHSSLFTFGMLYPPPRTVNFYSYLTYGVVERLATDTRGIEFGPYMHEAKRLCGAQMQPMLGRIAYVNPAHDSLFKRFVAPLVLPSLDTEDWDGYVGRYRWLARFASTNRGHRMLTRAMERKFDPEVFRAQIESAAATSTDSSAS